MSIKNVICAGYVKKEVFQSFSRHLFFFKEINLSAKYGLIYDKSDVSVFQAKTSLEGNKIVDEARRPGQKDTRNERYIKGNKLIVVRIASNKKMNK